MRYTWLAIAALVFLAGCATQNDEPTPHTCDPGSHIFCRCANGGPSTRECKDDGRGFYECESCDGSSTWDEPGGGEAAPPFGNDPPAGTSGAGGNGNSGSGNGGSGNGGSGNGGSGNSGSGASGGGGISVGAGGSSPGTGGSGPVATQPLFGLCTSDSGCASGICRSGYCTQSCSIVSDCPYPASECVAFDANNTVCMPSCNAATDCTEIGSNTQCGFTSAIDNWDVKTCAVWDTAHVLVPNDRDCLPFDHEACHLGYSGQEKVCSAEGKCATGCYVQKDCPQGKTCSSDGTSLGACQ